MSHWIKGCLTWLDLIKTIANPAVELPVFYIFIEYAQSSTTYAVMLVIYADTDITHCDILAILKELQILRCDVRRMSCLGGCRNPVTHCWWRTVVQGLKAMLMATDSLSILSPFDSYRIQRHTRSPKSSQIQSVTCALAELFVFKIAYESMSIWVNVPYFSTAQSHPLAPRSRNRRENVKRAKLLMLWRISTWVIFIDCCC